MAAEGRHGDGEVGCDKGRQQGCHAGRSSLCNAGLSGLCNTCDAGRSRLSTPASPPFLSALSSALRARSKTFAGVPRYHVVCVYVVCVCVCVCVCSDANRCPTLRNKQQLRISTKILPGRILRNKTQNSICFSGYAFLGPHTPGVVGVVAAVSRFGRILSHRPTAYGRGSTGLRPWAWGPGRR
jgi:hypothetical protein